MSDDDRTARSNPSRVPEALIGLGLLVFSAFVLWQIWANPAVAALRQGRADDVPLSRGRRARRCSPSCCWSQAARGGWQPDEEKEVAIDWRALAFVAAGLIANVALITWLGFTLASTVMFVLIAYGFGSRTPLRDAAIGFAVALAAYFGFAKALGVNIGAGWFETA